MPVKASEGSKQTSTHLSRVPRRTQSSSSLLDNYRMPCVVNWFASHLHIVSRIRRAQKPANQGWDVPTCTSANLTPGDPFPEHVHRRWGWSTRYSHPSSSMYVRTRIQDKLHTLSECLASPRGSANVVNQNFMTAPTYIPRVHPFSQPYLTPLGQSLRCAKSFGNACYIICGAGSESSDGGLMAGNGHCRVTVLQLACAASSVMRQHLFCCTICKGRWGHCAGAKS